MQTFSLPRHNFTRGHRLGVASVCQGSDDGSDGRALGYANVLDVLEIVDGAGDECEVVVKVGDPPPPPIRSECRIAARTAAGGGCYHLSRSSRRAPCSGSAAPSLRSARRPTATSGPNSNRVPSR